MMGCLGGADIIAGVLIMKIGSIIMVAIVTEPPNLYKIKYGCPR